MAWAWNVDGGNLVGFDLVKERFGLNFAFRRTRSCRAWPSRAPRAGLHE